MVNNWFGGHNIWRLSRTGFTSLVKLVHGSPSNLELSTLCSTVSHSEAMSYNESFKSSIELIPKWCYAAEAHLLMDVLQTAQWMLVDHYRSDYTTQVLPVILISIVMFATTQNYLFTAKKKKNMLSICCLKWISPNWHCNKQKNYQPQTIINNPSHSNYKKNKQINCCHLI